MKEQDFDNIIKQKLEGINEAPPAYMWDRVSSGIATADAVTPTAAISNGLKLFIAASLAIIVGATILLMNGDEQVTRKVHHKNIDKNLDYILVDAKNTSKNNNDIANNIEPSITSPTFSETNSISTPITSVNSNNSTPEKATPQKAKYLEGGHNNKAINRPLASSKNDNTVEPKQTIVNQELEPTIQSVNNKTVKAETNYIIPIVAVAANESTESVEKASIEVIETEAPSGSVVNNEETEVSAKNPVEEINQPKENTTEVKNTSVEPPIDKTNIKNNDPKNRFINKYALGIHYGPEFITAESASLTDQAFDLSFNYQNLNFIVQTGLGLRFSQDQAVYNMKYERWEYLETQIRFDSITFVIDQNGNYVAQAVDPYYEAVYDSVKHTHQATATVQNTIIQIPLLVGYQKDFKNFALFVKGGIRYSLITYQKTKDLYEIDEQSQMISLNYPEKPRTTSNIDYELSLGGAYKLNKNFQIQLEVFGRYYQNSIYKENPPSDVHPWSGSLRVGLLYIF